jgi:hypothetical protein
MKAHTIVRRLASGSLFTLALVSAAPAAETAAYVPRAEYDQLKQQLAALSAALPRGLAASDDYHAADV